MQQIVDRDEITDLVSRLGAWLDDKRFDEARSIFTEGATGETPGGTFRGIELLADQARRNHPVFNRTQHVITNVLIDLAGDRATVRANLVVTSVRGVDARRDENRPRARGALRFRSGWHARWMAALASQEQRDLVIAAPSAMTRSDALADAWGIGRPP